MNKKLHKILFSFFLILFGLIGFQYITYFAPNRPLEGAIIKEEKPVYSNENWLNKTYQNQFEKYHNQNFGFRNWFVRLHNQLHFWFYNKAKANGLVIGIDNYLFEKAYIDEINGVNFLGDSIFNPKFKILNNFNQYLKEKGKNLLFVIAPNKADYYKEKIPEKYLIQKPNIQTNYKYVLNGLEKNNIDYIDFNKWFIDNKSKAPYPLIPKTGIHWSQYGMNLVADSLTKKIEELRKNDLPDIKWSALTIKNHDYEGTDTDIENGMNLLFRINDENLAYPHIKYENSRKDGTNVIVISDSFFWSLYNNKYHLNVLNGTYFSFWYYYKDFYPKIDGFETLKEINNADIVIFVHTTATLNKFGYGFLEDFNRKSAINTDEFKAIRESILNNPEWMKDIERKADEKNITIDSMVTLDAIWSIKNKQ